MDQTTGETQGTDMTCDESYTTPTVRSSPIGVAASSPYSPAAAEPPTLPMLPLPPRTVSSRSASRRLYQASASWISFVHFSSLCDEDCRFEDFFLSLVRIYSYNTGCCPVASSPSARNGLLDGPPIVLFRCYIRQLIARSHPLWQHCISVIIQNSCIAGNYKQYT